MMQPVDGFERIETRTAEDVFGTLRAWIEVRADCLAQMTTSAAVQRRWALVPISEELVGKETIALAKACADWRFERAICINVNRFDPATAFRFKPTADALEKVHQLFPSPSHAIMAEDQQFLIVSDGDYYWEIGGPTRFVEQAIGRDVSSAIREFGAVATAYAARENASAIRKGLLDIYRNCITVYQHSQDQTG